MVASADRNRDKLMTASKPAAITAMLLHYLSDYSAEA
jgi:hypothetical protein